MAGSKFVGVDGCRDGWLSVGLNDDCEPELEVFSSAKSGRTAFEKLLGHYWRAQLILVDIPIGLPSDGKGRDCDGEAWKLLGWPRCSSIFPTPTRRSVEQVRQSTKAYKEKYADANKMETEVAGKEISPFSFALTDKIGEVDSVVHHARLVQLP